MPDAILSALWRSSWQAGVLCLLVLALRYTLRDWLPPAWRCRLWALVLLRLALPVVPASPVSLFNVVPAAPAPAEWWPTLTVVVRGDAMAGPTPSVPARSPAVGEAPPPPPRRLDGPTVWVGAWLAGVAVLATVTLVTHVRFARRVRRLARPTPPALATEWRDLGGRRPLVVTAAVGSPALFGVGRGRLLLPPDLADQLSAEQLRLVFRHELAHVRRWDLAVGSAAVLIRCVYWFHPAAWVAERSRRADAEAACDDRVTADDADRLAYGRTLLAVAVGGRAPALGMADGRTDLRRRLARIAAGRRPGRWSIGLAAALTAVVGCATLTGSDRPANVTRTYDRFWPQDYGGLKDEAGRRTLESAIRQSVTPDDWGRRGQDVRTTDKGVVVTAPPAVQAAVESMIADRMITVSVETRVLTLRPSQVRAAGLTAPPLNVAGPITRDDVGRLVDACERDKDAQNPTAPRLTLYNGRYWSSRRSRRTSADWARSCYRAKRPFDPVVGTTPATGFWTSVRVAVRPDRRSVDLTAEFQATRMVSLDPVRMTAVTGGRTVTGTYQVPHHRATEIVKLATRVASGASIWMRCRTVETYGGSSPTTQSLLYKGQRLSGGRAATRPADPDAPEAFVLWQVTVLPSDASTRPFMTFPATRPATSAEGRLDARASHPGVKPVPTNLVDGPSPVRSPAAADDMLTPDGRGLAVALSTDVHGSVVYVGDNEAPGVRRLVSQRGGTVSDRLDISTDYAVLSPLADSDSRATAKALHVPVLNPDLYRSFARPNSAK